MISVPYELTWIEGRLAGSYIHDVEVGTAFASLNRHIIVQEILRGMKWKADDIEDERDLFKLYPERYSGRGSVCLP